MWTAPFDVTQYAGLAGGRAKEVSTRQYLEGGLDNHMYSTRHSTAFGAPERDETQTSMDEKISDVTVQIQAADARAEKAIAAAAL